MPVWCTAKIPFFSSLARALPGEMRALKARVSNVLLGLSSRFDQGAGTSRGCAYGRPKQLLYQVGNCNRESVFTLDQTTNRFVAGPSDAVCSVTSVFVAYLFVVVVQSHLTPGPET